MLKLFLTLEWKSFVRSSSFATNLALRIVMVLVALYFMAMFLLLGFGIYPLLKERGFEPFETVNKFLIYYFVFDLVMRYFLQKMPVVDIRPLLVTPLKKNVIVHFTLGKTVLSFFNWSQALFFVPFSIMLIINHYPVQNVLLWHLGMFGIVYVNNFINVLINNKSSVFYAVLAVLLAAAAGQYYSIFDWTTYTILFFKGIYSTSYLFTVPLILGALLYYAAFVFFKSNLNLVQGLASSNDFAKTENYSWLNQFGSLGTFLKNDIRLLRRNKRSKTTLVMSFLFLFYGLLFFTNPTQPKFMGIFAGIFVSGGFLFTFGQFVPSWDSSYYQLMMSQNIKYSDYLKSKWLLVVIATVISTFLASFYILISWHTYLLVVVGAIYNIGVNSHLVLLGGAFVKTPIDLTKTKGAFGDKQAFNLKTMLIAIPKLVLPVLLYVLGKSLFSENIGLIFVAAAGIVGFALRSKVFLWIEKIYKTEKYATIAAYKKE